MELLVLATGAGSLVLSHVNRLGFWSSRSSSNMTVPQTLKTGLSPETIIGVAASRSPYCSLAHRRARRAQRTRRS